MEVALYIQSCGEKQDGPQGKQAVVAQPARKQVDRRAGYAAADQSRTDDVGEYPFVFPHAAGFNLQGPELHIKEQVHQVAQYVKHGAGDHYIEPQKNACRNDDHPEEGAGGR